MRFIKSRWKFLLKSVSPPGKIKKKSNAFKCAENVAQGNTWLLLFASVSSCLFSH